MKNTSSLKRSGFRTQPLSEKLEKQEAKRLKFFLEGEIKARQQKLRIKRAKVAKQPLQTPLVRKPLKRIGTIGKANMEANQILAEILPKEYCEVRFNKDVTCMGNWPLQWAHRHKRAFYKGDVTKLSDIQEVVVACQVCHDRMEHDAELTEKVFKKLRP